MRRSAWIARPPRVIAHRGASAHAPENTLAAFRLALEQGAQALEFDVHLTQDDVPVVIHDETLLRTTGDARFVRDVSAEELARLDAGRGERVPTLAQVLSLAKGRALVDIEIKTDGTRDYAGIEGIILAAVEAAGSSRETLFTSFAPASLKVMQEIAPTIPRGVLQVGIPDEDEIEVHRDYAHVIGLWHECVTPEILALASGAEMAVVAWTVNDPEVAASLLTMGVVAVITDDPLRVRS